MSSSTIAAIGSNPTINSVANPLDTSLRIPQQTIGQDGFLKILVAQMTSQDPLNPKSDTDYVAQMAQFTSLEQSKSMSGDMALLQANSLLGRTVSLNDDQGQPVAGVVDAVDMTSGTPQIVIGGNSYSLDHLVAIAPTSTPVQP